MPTETSIEDEYDLGTGLQVITIVIDQAKDAPEIFLDDVDPETAIIIFRKAAEGLEDSFIMPRIYSGGEIIAEEVTYSSLFEDDDDDGDSDSMHS